MFTIQKEYSYGILAIVAIVAIVALFNLSSTKVITTTDAEVSEAKDLAGEVIGFNRNPKTKNIILPNLNEEPTVCEASVVKGRATEGTNCDVTDPTTGENCCCELCSYNGLDVCYGCDCNNFCDTGGDVGDNFYDYGGTIRCENAAVGGTGLVYGVEYLAVNNTLIRNIPGPYTYTTICTSHVTDMNELFFK